MQMQLVESARVPVLTLTTPKGLVCDVSVNTLNSVKHTEFFKQVIHQTPSIRPLMRLLKYWAKVRRLPTMREGGVPSIVWMMLAVYLGSCPTPMFSTLVEESPSISNLLEKCRPVEASLYKFFRLAESRKSLARNLLAQSCPAKDPQHVSQRVSSKLNADGIWDEVFSVEDPALSTHAAKTARDSVWTNSEATTFEPGGPTDLAAKISCGTWLTYLVELKRASVAFQRLFTFMKEATDRVAGLQETMLERSFALLHHPKSGATGTVFGDERSADKFIARRFREQFSFVFCETFSERFILPGCDERLRSRGETDTKSQVRQVLRNKVDHEWHAMVVSARGEQERVYRPFCECCTSLKTELAVVLLHGRLHLLKLTSICADWSTWWTRDFLSRRDLRSVIHGTLHHVVTPETVKSLYPDQDFSHFTHVDLPPSGWPCSDKRHASCDKKQAAGDKKQAAGDKEVPFPYLVLPVRKQSDMTPVEVLFHPCHFVCRIRGWEVPDHCGQGLAADDVYYLETDEYQYLKALDEIVQEAPWYHLTANFGLSDDEDSSFQCAAQECTQCGVVGDLMNSLHTLAGYRCPDGIFQIPDPIPASNPTTEHLPANPSVTANSAQGSAEAEAASADAEAASAETAPAAPLHVIRAEDTMRRDSADQCNTDDSETSPLASVESLAVSIKSPVALIESPVASIESIIEELSQEHVVADGAAIARENGDVVLIKEVKSVDVRASPVDKTRDCVDPSGVLSEELEGREDLKYLPLHVREAIGAAWTRWEHHVKVSELTHRDAEIIVREEEEDAEAGQPEGDRTAAELVRATQLLAATIEGMQHEVGRQLQRPRKPRVDSMRRVMSLPSRTDQKSVSELMRRQRAHRPADVLAHKALGLLRKHETVGDLGRVTNTSRDPTPWAPHSNTVTPTTTKVEQRPETDGRPQELRPAEDRSVEDGRQMEGRLAGGGGRTPQVRMGTPQVRMGTPQVDVRTPGLGDCVQTENTHESKREKVETNTRDANPRDSSARDSSARDLNARGETFSPSGERSRDEVGTNRRSDLPRYVPPPSRRNVEGRRSDLKSSPAVSGSRRLLQSALKGTIPLSQ